MPRVPFTELVRVLQRVLVEHGLTAERAAFVAERFAENQRDGVHSHGLNRFPSFLAQLKGGRLVADAEPVRIAGLGALEQWDGRMGIGLWNAHVAMRRAVALAETHGLGCVGLRNTNHWMRAGTYGLQAAEAGCIGICWTNTLPLMPPWGAAEVAIGNNPLVVAVPRSDGPLLVDLAMSQFSNGKLEVMRRQGASLPTPGGYDNAGELTRDPGAILASRRPLPIGLWKGSALAVALDAAAALASGGQASHQIGAQDSEYAVAQVFIAIGVTALAGTETVDATVDGIIAHLHRTRPLDPAVPVRYPGEGMKRHRQESLAQGVPVDDAQWTELCGR